MSHVTANKDFDGVMLIVLINDRDRRNTGLQRKDAELVRVSVNGLNGDYFFIEIHHVLGSGRVLDERCSWRSTSEISLRVSRMM